MENKIVLAALLVLAILLTGAVCTLESVRDCSRDCFDRASLPQTPQCAACDYCRDKSCGE